MQDIETYYSWRHLYIADEDDLSPFYGREYNEFEYTNTVYNYYIHPQWDDFGSSTLYMKVLFSDYDQNFAILEFIGEWNDAINNDIMLLKRDVIDVMICNGINKYILIGENVLNFHASDDCYYQEFIERENNHINFESIENFKKRVVHNYFGYMIFDCLFTYNYL